MRCAGEGLASGVVAAKYLGQTDVSGCHAPLAPRIHIMPSSFILTHALSNQIQETSCLDPFFFSISGSEVYCIHITLLAIPRGWSCCCLLVYPERASGLFQLTRRGHFSAISTSTSHPSKLSKAPLHSMRQPTWLTERSHPAQNRQR